MYKKSICIAIVVVLIMVGCRQEDDIVSNANNFKKKVAIDAKTEAQLNYLVNVRGHERDSIIVTDEYFSVDHVVYSRKMKIPSESSEGIMARRSNYTYYGGSKVLYRKDHLVVYMSPHSYYPQSWIDATIAAINKWNALSGFDINFVFDRNSAPIDVIEVKYLSFSSVGWLNNSWDAAASAPTGGFAGRNIWINSDRNPSSNQKCHAMMHELGHAINFGHTSHAWWGGKSCDAQTSIMHPINNSNTDFNDCDIDFFTSYY